MKRVIGITGGIASGKSTVSQYLLSKKFQVVDCDLLTRQSYIDRFKEIQEAFPDCIVDGAISRPMLASRVFSNETAKQNLEKIIHTYVRHQMKKTIHHTKNGLIFLDIPLLYEAHMEDLCDEIWVIYVSEQQQLERLMQRNQMDEKTALMRIQAQMSIEEKRLKADYVIDNSTNLVSLYQQIEQRLEELDEYNN